MKLADLQRREREIVQVLRTDRDERDIAHDYRISLGTVNRIARKYRIVRRRAHYDCPVALHYHALRLLLDGHEQQDVAARLKVHRNSVCTWAKAAREAGFEMPNGTEGKTA